MQAGSRLHETLEGQVHTTVEMLVKTREEAWGLKIWNIIQGLRTLRNLGFTREFEVWGVVDGQVVNGIIDEVSYTRPDTTRRRKSKSSSPEPKDVVATSSDSKQVYITDVKTRGSSKKPLPSGSSLRPPEMQLMLYRKLLTSLATNQVDAETVLERYRLKPHEQFTDAFIAEVAQLDFNSSDESPHEDTAVMNSQDDSLSELAAHNTLAKLWQLMIQEFSQAMPGPDPVSGLLRVEFRSRKSGHHVIGNKFFDYDEEVVSRHLADVMSWWRGERSAKGVHIEEAFKCGFCDFAESCDWRKNKVDEAVAKFRQKFPPREREAAAA